MVLLVKFPSNYPFEFKSLKLDRELTVSMAIFLLQDHLGFEDDKSKPFGLYIRSKDFWLEPQSKLRQYNGLQFLSYIEYKENKQLVSSREEEFELEFDEDIEYQTVTDTMSIASVDPISTLLELNYKEEEGEEELNRKSEEVMHLIKEAEIIVKPALPRKSAKPKLPPKHPPVKKLVKTETPVIPPVAEQIEKPVEPDLEQKVNSQSCS